MTVRVMGLIELQDPSAFDVYRQHVGATVEQYGGQICARGIASHFFWNELECAPFSAFVELSFPSANHAHSWAHSPEYQALIPIRNKAMTLTLFSLEAT
ncbi:MAG: DUF1330 domain-containing protein [Polynucleobacter sp.]|nr:DUF1330 domain-containing protein [Polynucleobacter sp.]MDZ4056403.1 DUF1330 domain-containing protein [Polynucleobacter sp.]